MQEVVMVAADVDNDLFRIGENVSHGDGEGLANLSYRITALYTGRDNVLGASAGLKHFGKRRLGRAGLDNTCPVPDNVWDVDCTSLFERDVNSIEIHGEYFDPAEEKIYQLFRGILEGRDRSLLINDGSVPKGLCGRRRSLEEGQRNRVYIAGVRVFKPHIRCFVSQNCHTLRLSWPRRRPAGVCLA